MIWEEILNTNKRAPDCASGCEEFFVLDKMGVNTAWNFKGVMESDSDLKMGDYGESFQIYVPIVDYKTEGKGCKMSENIFHVPMLNLLFKTILGIKN